MRKSSEKTHEIKLSRKIVAVLMMFSYISTASNVYLFAQEANTVVKEEKSEVLISAANGGTVTLGDASIEIPGGALKKDTLISITRLYKVEDTGESLYNATPKSGGYRFLPAGTRFEKDVTITLPYSAELNAKPQSLEELYTYFYDTKKKSWIKLERLEVDRIHNKVRSLSTHFTDMINATLTIPQSAGPVDVNLNSIKNLEAAKPDSHLIKFNPPKANNIGDAAFSFELAVPSGRRGMQPQVTINYSSAYGNGIMGRGFDINCLSSITTDTRFGLPNYDTHDTYMLDGIILDEKERSGTKITYTPQKETEFSRIVRYGAGTDSDYWEITGKDGTKRTYAQNKLSCTGSGKKTFAWNLTKIQDVHGNNVIYEYNKFENPEEETFGYVYPTAIYYTGCNEKQGNYSIKFNYDENNIQREDIRTDARSRKIVACRKLLTSVTAQYKNQKPLRKYSFSYKDGPAKEKMLELLTVTNNADESYEYSFAYEEPKLDANNNPIYFDSAKPWNNSKAISDAEGKNAGANVHSSLGAGFGFACLDVRGSGGVTGSVSSSKNYTKENLIDIDGDGKCERIVQSGNSLLIYTQNQNCTGFVEDPLSINLENVMKKTDSFLMDRESSQTTSYGWNVYGGTGDTAGVAGTGYVYSKVQQEGGSKIYTGFYDMDGDGLSDIITSSGEYLHNDTKETGKISFSSKNIINYPSYKNKQLDTEKLKEYRKSYCLQRPFIAWEPYYDGTIQISSEYSDESLFSIIKVYGKNNIEGNRLTVTQGNCLYFIPDTGNSPDLSDLEKEIFWDNKIEYTKARVFGHKLEMPLFFPDQTVKEVPEQLKNIYSPVYSEENHSILYYELESNYENRLTKTNKECLISQKKFIPGVMDENTFSQVKAYVIAKSKNISLETDRRLFLSKFAGAYTYSLSDRMFHLTQKPERDFYEAYLKGVINAEAVESVINCYKQNGIKTDITENELSYKISASSDFDRDKGIEGKKHSQGSLYVKNGKKLANLGSFLDGELVVDIKNKKVVSSADFAEDITVSDFSNDRCILNVDNGKYIITYTLSQKVPYADSISQEEFLLIADDFKDKYPDNSIESLTWKIDLNTTKKELIQKLKNAFVDDEAAQKSFIEIIQDAGNETDVNIKKEKLKGADKILKDAMIKRIQDLNFPFYDENLCLKDEYQNPSGSSGTELLIEECSKHNLCRFKYAEIEIEYSTDAFYDVENGFVSLLGFNSSSDAGITVKKQKLEFPDGKSTFSSRLDFSTENTADLSKSVRLFTESENNDVISTPVKEFLYGGKYCWFYGIWNGSEEENSFSEAKLYSIFNHEAENYTQYGFSETVSDEDIKNAGNNKAGEINEKPVQTDYSFGCTLPQKNETILEGISSKYIKETVYDENGTLKSNSTTVESKPYIGKGIFVCNRLGGNAYFSIEGIPETSGSAEGFIQKIETRAEDVTSGPQDSILGFSEHTNSTNEGSSKLIQNLMDVNGDRIPDVIKINGSTCSVFCGKKDSNNNIEYPSEPTFTTGVIDGITKNWNKSTSNGFSFSPSGAIAPLYGKNGKLKGINLTNGFGKSDFKGENKSYASVLDINGDGIADYITGNTAYLGKGGDYENAFSYNWSFTSEGSVSGNSYNINTGGGVPFITEKQILYPDKEKTSQKLSSGVSAGLGGCISISSTVQNQILTDMNGDGLIDIVRKASVQDDLENCIYDVYYNTGSKISSEHPAQVRIPKWGTVTFNGFDISTDAINSNKISYGGSDVQLTESAQINLEQAAKDINNLDCSITASTNITGNCDININIGIPSWPLTFLQTNITTNAGGGITAGNTTTSTTVKMMDLDGDGLCDHVLKVSGHGIFWQRNLSGKFGLLNKINLPQGGNIQVEYEEKYGTTDNPFFKYVMNRVTINDGTDKEDVLPELKHGAHCVTTCYDYSDGYYDRQKRDFYGFRTVQTTLSDGTYTVAEYKNRDYYLKGCITKIESRTYDGAILSKSMIEYCESPVSLPEKEESLSYEKFSGESDFIHTTIEYKYDGWGNCTEIKQNFGDGKSLSAEIKYDNTNVTDYIIGLPADICVYDSNETILRRRSGNYDEKGQLKELKQYFDACNYSVNTLNYDSYGNIKSVTDSRGATLTYSYDNDENMFVTEISQAGENTDTYKSTISYEVPTQTKLEETDCNGNTLKYKYDNWQRVSKIFTAYDTIIPAVSYEYHTPSKDESGHHELWYAVTNNKVTFDSSDSNIIQTVIQIDGLGRTVRTAKTGFVNGIDGWNASGAVEYDYKGRIVKEGMTEFIKGSLDDLLKSPPKMTDLFTSYEYDEKDRQVKTTLPDSSKQFAEFEIKDGNLVSKSIDPLENISIQETDSRGNIVRVEKHDKDAKLLTEVTYKYNEMGEMLKAFDAKGNPITVEYDLLGRRTALESLDSGRQEFFYDDCSNLVRENNSVLRENNKQIVYEYDGLNRLIKIDYPDTEDAVYTYGGANDTRGAAGKLLKIKDASGTLEYEYGKLGEITKETRTLATHLNGNNPTETAVMEYCSDYLGRMQWITYPDGEKITYGYDNGGQVVSVKGEHYGHDFNYVTNILYDQYGQRTRIDYGNGTFTEYNYNPERRWLDSIKTQNKWGQSYQNISYSFDAVGNVLGYENDCLNSVTGNYKTKQTYSYDSLYQLIKAEGETTYNPYHSSASEFKSNYSQNFEFDAYGLGNMMCKISKESVTPHKSIGDNLNYSFNYVYDENYAHRLVKAGDRYYKYDANGNIICEQDGSFESGEDDVSYHKINNEDEDVYSTDYGWGLFKDKEAGEIHKKSRYRRTYVWDERNQLISSIDSNYNTAYIYGQDGQRSNKYTQSSETLYFNKMWTLHTDSGNNIYGGQTAKNIYLGETRIVTKLNSGNAPTYQEEYYKQYFYHSDHLGSASLISDYKGDEYQRIEYTPYGETWVEKTQNAGLEYLPYKFTAKELDEETGLYYYGARYLDPKYSMWISTDPALGEYIPKAPINEESKKYNQNLPGMGGVFNHINSNLYHYGANNPVRYIDPDGRSGEMSQILQQASEAGEGALVVFAVIFVYHIVTNSELRQEIADAAASVCKIISNVCQSVVDCAKKNVEHYKLAKTKAKELANEYTDRKLTGSYTIFFESGKTYSGKGGVRRAIESAAVRSTAYTTMPVGIDWTPAASLADAFEDEYIRIQDHGGPMSRHLKDINFNPNYDHPNYNEIQSPGEAVYLMRHGTIYNEKNPNAME